MTAAPGSRFVDGLRVTPAHLNHAQAVAAAAWDDLRRVVGLGRVGAGFLIEVAADGTVSLSPGIAFTDGGSAVRRDQPTAVTLPDGNESVTVAVRAISQEDPTSRVDDQATIVFAATEVVVDAVVTPDADTVVLGTVRHEAGGVTVERVVQVAANRLLWVQVRSADQATANRVLDSVAVHGM